MTRPSEQDLMELWWGEPDAELLRKIQRFIPRNDQVTTLWMEAMDDLLAKDELEPARELLTEYLRYRTACGAAKQVKGFSRAMDELIHEAMQLNRRGALRVRANVGKMLIGQFGEKSDAEREEGAGGH